MLSGLQNPDGSPFFKGVYDRKPPRADRQTFPCVIVMTPESQNVREGMRLKLDKFGCQLRIAYALAQQDWPAQGTGPGGNIYYAPDSEPQVVFDSLIDQLVDLLVENQSFTQNVPGGDRSTIQLGQKISVKLTEPEKRGQSLMLGAIVEFEVTELLTGV